MFLEESEESSKGLENIKGIFLIIFFLFCIFLVVVIHIGKILWTYQKQDSVYSEFKELVISDTENHLINTDLLKKFSSSSVSWIYIPGTNVDYPMVQGRDNYEFLDKDAYGNLSNAGAIFLNSYNNPDMTDSKSIIFGHNMKNGSMFYDIKKYAKEDYIKEHDKLYLYMQDGSILTYHFVCTFETTAQDDIVYTCNTAQSVEDAIMPLLLRASTIYAKSNDKPFILLSTCIKDDNRCICLFQQDE